MEKYEHENIKLVDDKSQSIVWLIELNRFWMIDWIDGWTTHEKIISKSNRFDSNGNLKCS